MSRILALVTIAAGLTLGSMWIAEDSMFPSSILSSLHIHSPWLALSIAVAVMMLFAAVGAAVVWKRGRVARVAGAVLFVIALIGGYLAGDREMSRALNECPDAVQRLREQLASFHQRNGRYPDALAQLGSVPCQRRLRGTLLFYRRTSSGYDLVFGDDLVSWDATEQGMTVIK